MLPRLSLWLSLLIISSCVGVKSQSVSLTSHDYIKANIIQRIIIATNANGDSLPLVRGKDLPSLTRKLAELYNYPSENTDFPLTLTEYKNPHNTILPGTFFQLTIDQPIVVTQGDTSIISNSNSFGCDSKQWPATILAYYQLESDGKQVLKTLSGPAYLDPIGFPFIGSPYREPGLSMALFYRFFQYGIIRPANAMFTNQTIKWDSYIREALGIKQADILGVFTTSKTETPKSNRILLYVTENEGYIRGHIVCFGRGSNNTGKPTLIKYSASSVINTTQSVIECFSAVVLTEEESLKIFNGPLKQFIY